VATDSEVLAGVGAAGLPSAGSGEW
jgi:hypothetical protein